MSVPEQCWEYYGAGQLHGWIAGLTGVVLALVIAIIVTRFSVNKRIKELELELKIANRVIDDNVVNDD